MFGLSDIVVTFFSVVTICRLWTLNGRVTHAAVRTLNGRVMHAAFRITRPSDRASQLTELGFSSHLSMWTICILLCTRSDSCDTLCESIVFWLNALARQLVTLSELIRSDDLHRFVYRQSVYCPELWTAGSRTIHMFLLWTVLAVWHCICSHDHITFRLALISLISLSLKF